jgi:hypothetical protein
VSASSWVGSVWSHRGGRVVIGRLRAVEGDTATLAVVGLGPDVPDGARVLPKDDGGNALLEISLLDLLGRWKRMGQAAGSDVVAPG